MRIGIGLALTRRGGLTTSTAAQLAASGARQLVCAVQRIAAMAAAGSVSWKDEFLSRRALREEELQGLAVGCELEERRMLWPEATQVSGH